MVFCIIITTFGSSVTRPDFRWKLSSLARYAYVWCLAMFSLCMRKRYLVSRHKICCYQRCISHSFECQHRFVCLLCKCFECMVVVRCCQAVSLWTFWWLVARPSHLESCTSSSLTSMEHHQAERSLSLPYLRVSVCCLVRPKYVELLIQHTSTCTNSFIFLPKIALKIIIIILKFKVRVFL